MNKGHVFLCITSVSKNRNCSGQTTREEGTDICDQKTLSTVHLKPNLPQLVFSNTAIVHHSLATIGELYVDILDILHVQTTNIACLDVSSSNNNNSNNNNNNNDSNKYKIPT